jgi:hypothetical protein
MFYSSMKNSLKYLYLTSRSFFFFMYKLLFQAFLKLDHRQSLGLGLSLNYSFKTGLLVM